MQISKLLSAVCAIAFCAGLVSVRAEDNPAQAAARAALMEQLNGANENAPTNQTPPVLIDSSGVMNVQTNLPEPVLPPVMTNSSAAQMPPEAAQTMQENQPLQKEAEAAEKKRLEDEAKARKKAEAAARAQAKQEAKAQKEAAKAAKKNPAMPQPSVNNAGANLGLQPIEAPALPISMTKEQQLQALDARYKADQISPEEYFKQREAILAGP